MDLEESEDIEKIKKSLENEIRVYENSGIFYEILYDVKILLSYIKKIEKENKEYGERPNRKDYEKVCRDNMVLRVSRKGLIDKLKKDIESDKKSAANSLQSVNKEENAYFLGKVVKAQEILDY